VITPLFLALDTPQSPIGEVLLCQAIIVHMNRKLAALRCEDGNTLNRLAARPYSKMLNAVSRQICATDPDSEPLEAHLILPRSTLPLTGSLKTPRLFCIKNN
jgi:hypothetical protein